MELSEMVQVFYLISTYLSEKVENAANAAFKTMKCR